MTNMISYQGLVRTFPNTASPQIFIKSVEIANKATTPTWSKDDIAIGLNEKATIQVDDILVVTT
ncbi:hypothetical protein [Citrobacter portucalensis]|uniref:hypothetical protein n=1 Tax=Citrobacter portucalensis TaxID=1639133 RepID=UPI00293465D1|nr:hypothetical protein [Citrobacter portucalensis]